MRVLRCLFFFVCVVALCSWGRSAHAQTTGDLDGTVVDQSGSPLPGVSVELRSPQLQGSRTAVTDIAGRFRFPVLGPGVYSVTTQLSGFAKVERSNQRVALGATTTVAITMGLSLKEEIVVTSEAPAVDTSRMVRSCDGYTHPRRYVEAGMSLDGLSSASGSETSSRTRSCCGYVQDLRYVANGTGSAGLSKASGSAASMTRRS